MNQFFEWLIKRFTIVNLFLFVNLFKKETQFVSWDIDCDMQICEPFAFELICLWSLF